MRLDVQFLQTAVADMEIISSGSVSEYLFSIDSRTLQEGEIFIAIKGNQVDGHDFIESALARKAAGIIIASDKKQLLEKIEPALKKKLFIACVADPAASLVQWATAWRARFDIPVIGITGSMGKTSTKELLSRILTLHGLSHVASYGNQNTKFGLALNLLRLRAQHKVAIMEMGISMRGEMAQLAAMVKPTTAIITTVGHCHMEGLGSLNDIALEKKEIFKYFTENSIGIINGDVPLLSGSSYIHPVIKFGAKTINQIQARKIQIGGSQTTFVLKVYKQKYQVMVPKVHEGVVFNTLAATAAAYLLTIPVSTILKAVQTPITVEGRFEQMTVPKSKTILINDCYNANPESMKAALLAFEKFETSGQKIAVLGDMLELGVNSPFWHRQLGRFLRKVPSLKKVILVGDMVKWTKKTALVTLAIEMVPTWQEALTILEKDLPLNPVILVKGSLGMNLNKLVDSLMVENKGKSTTLSQSYSQAHV